MAKGTINPNKLLDKIESVLVIDLLEAVSVIDDALLETLVPAPPGIYVKNSLKPIIDYSKIHYTRQDYLQKPMSECSLDGILKLKSDILNHEGETVLNYKEVVLRKSMLFDKPTLPVMGVKLAVTLILDYLTTIAPYTRCLKYDRQEQLIREEHHGLIELDTFEEKLEKTLDTIFDFVNEDVWYIYFTRVKGTTFVLEKVIDYRIFRYHELEMIKAMENDDDYGVQSYRG
jgi:hypothetical protein